MRAFPDPIRDVKRASLLAAALTLGGAVAVFWFGTARTMNVRPQWTPGKAFVYELSTRGEGIDTPAALFGNVSVPGQRYTVGVDGRLRATVLRANDDGATVAWTVDSPKAEFAADGKIDAAYSAALTRDLGGSFVTRSDGDGRVVAFLGDRRATDLGNAYMRALTSTFEIAQPQRARGFGRAWQADETDVDGARTSEYALQLWLDNPIALPTARFTRDATIRSPRGDDPFAVEPRVIAKCFDQGLLREDGVLAHIVATERRAVNVGDRRIATSQSTVIATLVAISRVPEGSLSRETENALSHADGLRVVRNRADVRAAAYRRAAAATTSDAVFAKLQTLPLRATNVTALSQELAAQFFVHPQTIARVAATLRSAPADSAPFAASRSRCRMRARRARKSSFRTRCWLAHPIRLPKLSPLRSPAWRCRATRALPHSKFSHNATPLAAASPSSRSGPLHRRWGTRIARAHGVLPRDSRRICSTRGALRQNARFSSRSETRTSQRPSRRSCRTRAIPTRDFALQLRRRYAVFAIREPTRRCERSYEIPTTPCGFRARWRFGHAISTTRTTPRSFGPRETTATATCASPPSTFLPMRATSVRRHATSCSRFRRMRAM